MVKRTSWNNDFMLCIKVELYLNIDESIAPAYPLYKKNLKGIKAYEIFI